MGMVLVSTTSTMKTTELAARARAVEEAVHSGEMEGFTVTPATRADADEYAAGTIDIDELGARIRARHRKVE